VENVTFVVYVPGARVPRWTDIESALLERAAREPEVAARESHAAFSDAVHVTFFRVVFFSETDALVPVEPKFTSRGDTSKRLFAPRPAGLMDSFSTGEGELQAMGVHTARMAARRTRRDRECIGSLSRSGSMDGAGL
jgi:hypothetical protein